MCWAGCGLLAAAVWWTFGVWCFVFTLVMLVSGFGLWCVIMACWTLRFGWLVVVCFEVGWWLLLMVLVLGSVWAWFDAADFRVGLMVY